MRARAPEWLVVLGAVIFVLVLFVSAWFEPDIRWLHFFQAWMYIATVALALRQSRWGYFLGISVAAFWDYANIVATDFFYSGLVEVGRFVRTGSISRPDLMIAVPAWVANFTVIVGCVWAYSRLERRPVTDVARFGIVVVLSTAFFAADMAVFQPRYLALFPRLLPWR